MTADPTAVAAARDLLQQIALELAFVDPLGTSDPAALRELVRRLGTAVDAADPALRDSVQQALGWLSGTTGEATRPDPDALARCSAWQPWMVEAVTAWERGQPLPPPPSMPPTAPQPHAAEIPTTAPPAPHKPAAFTGGEPVQVLAVGHDPEIMRMFCEEAADLLRDIEQGVLVLETRPGDPDTLATVFRAFHTLKGNSALIKLVELHRLTHDVESLLDAARRGARRLDREAIDVILAAADCVARFVAEMARQVEGINAGQSLDLPLPEVLEAIAAILATTPQPRSGEAPAPLPTPRAAAALVSTAAAVPEAAAPPVPAPVPPALPASVAGASIRVDTHKLDGLIDLVGELVIAQSMVVQDTKATRAADEHLARALGRLRGITSDLQRTAMALRMVPIRGTFQKLARLVRDTAAELGKDVRLVLEGEETELDRSVIEQVGDPLVHMIRNAIDHGIELPAVREAAGKSVGGTIRLSACHQGGFVVIRIADDGRGLDPDRIRAKAIERGLVTADSVLDERETLELIFAAGFSTAEQITGLSGRGVGMDVVRRNIEGIRGKIEIESTVGTGTTFTIFMPLTLAIIEGLLVAAGDQRFVIPTLSVRESLRPRAGDVTTVHGRGELVNVRGRLVPLLRLGRHFGFATRAAEPSDGIVVVVEVGQECRGLLVDDLLGRQEVVIKSLGETFSGRRGFAGAAILGDGRVGLILDTNALVRLRPTAAGSAA